jgi:hypothetical protein
VNAVMGHETYLVFKVSRLFESYFLLNIKWGMRHQDAIASIGVRANSSAALSHKQGDRHI